MKILITGGAGLIGSNIVRRLVLSDYDVFVADNLWKGKIENQSEYLALFKTTKTKLRPLKKELEKLHPYDVPEIVEINPISMNKPYLKWLVDSTV